ncbi:MAG: metallophosphoesterase [Pseudomonadota bacterium]
MPRFRLAHLSDPHLGPLPRIPPLALASKRIFGAINWARNRGRAMAGEVLTALLTDLAAQSPDHIVVTGDLTNIALDEEFKNARTFLERLGPPARVTAIPGNHDAYVPGAVQKAVAAWGAYVGGPFPTVHRREGIALIGVSSAIATLPLSAAGAVGARQREALAVALDRADDAMKIVLIHHPPDRALAKGRRGLRDVEAVRQVLSEGCPDLILHGHNHEFSTATLETARRPAPILGVPSASSGGQKHPPAGYGLLDIDVASRTITLSRRTFDPDTGTVRGSARTTL